MDEWRTAKSLYPLIDPNETVRNEKFIQFILFLPFTRQACFLKVFWFGSSFHFLLFIYTTLVAYHWQYNSISKKRKRNETSNFVGKNEINFLFSTEFSNEFLRQSIFLYFDVRRNQGERKEAQKTFRLPFFFRRATRRKIWGDVSRVTGDIDYPESRDPEAGRIGRLSSLLQGRRESWSRLVDWKVNRKRIYTKHHDGYGYVSWTKRKGEKNIGKRIEMNLVYLERSLVNLFRNKIDRSIDRSKAIRLGGSNGGRGTKWHRSGCSLEKLTD